MAQFTARLSVLGAETAFGTMPRPGKVAATGTDSGTAGAGQQSFEPSAPIDDGYDQGGGVLHRINLTTDTRHGPQVKLFAATLADGGVV